MRSDHLSTVIKPTRLQRKWVLSTLLLAFLFGCADNGRVSENSENRGDFCPDFASVDPTDDAVLVTTRDDGRPFFPLVYNDGSKLVMLTNVIAFGSGRVSVWRQESSDGINFDEGYEVETLSGPDFNVGDVIQVGDDWYLVYATVEETEPGDEGLRNAIGMATSQEGLVWQDLGVVYEGSGEDFDSLLMQDPRLHHDGERFHLYYTGWQEICGGDECNQGFSVAHATSDDGRDFQFESALFESSDCPDVSGRANFTLGSVVRSLCADCAVDGVDLLIAHGGCRESSSDPFTRALYLAHSPEGFAFGELVEAAEQVDLPTYPYESYASTAFYDGERIRWYFSGEDGFEVFTRGVAPPEGSGLVCR